MDVLNKEGKVAIFLAKGSVSLVKFLLCLHIAKSILITHKLLPMLLVPLICLSRKLRIHSKCLLSSCKDILVDMPKAEKLWDGRINSGKCILKSRFIVCKED